MSSRIAVCGQHPVSTATMRSVGSTAARAQRLGVLGREDVVGDDDERQLVAQQRAQRADERRLASPDRPADADAQRPVDAARRMVVTWAADGQVVMQGVMRRTSCGGMGTPIAGRGRRELCVVRASCDEQPGDQPPWCSPRISDSGRRRPGGRRGPSTHAPTRRGLRRPTRRRRACTATSERVEPEQPHGGGGDRRAEVVQDERGGVGRRAARRRDRAPSAIGWWAHRGSRRTASTPAPGQMRAEARTSWRPSRRLIVRSGGDVDPGGVLRVQSAAITSRVVGARRRRGAANAASTTPSSPAARQVRSSVATSTTSPSRGRLDTGRVGVAARREPAVGSSSRAASIGDQ